MMKNALIIVGVMTLSLMGLWGMYMVNDQTVAGTACTFLLAAEEEEEFQVDIKEEEIVGPDRIWNVQSG